MCAPRMTRHASIRYSAVKGRPLYFCLHRHPVSVKCLYHTRMVLSVGGSFWVLCTKCTLHSNHILTVWYSNIQNTFPLEPPFSDYIHSHRLAAEKWTTMKNKLLRKHFLSCFFYLYRFRKYVSYSFPIINFCNTQYLYLLEKIYKVQHLEGSGKPVLYIGRTVFEG
jgi:hypothetical protein